MKNLLCAIVFIFALASCGGNSQTGNTNATDAAPATQQTAKGKEYTSKYVCPMHCKGSGASAKGECPVCGMDYVVNENWKDPHEGHGHDGHNHDGHGHEGHSH